MDRDNGPVQQPFNEQMDAMENGNEDGSRKVRYAMPGYDDLPPGPPAQGAPPAYQQEFDPYVRPMDMRYCPVPSDPSRQWYGPPPTPTRAWEADDRPLGHPAWNTWVPPEERGQWKYESRPMSASYGPREQTHPSRQYYGGQDERYDEYNEEVRPRSTSSTRRPDNVAWRSNGLKRRVVRGEDNVSATEDRRSRSGERHDAHPKMGGSPQQRPSRSTDGRTSGESKNASNPKPQQSNASRGLRGVKAPEQANRSGVKSRNEAATNTKLPPLKDPNTNPSLRNAGNSKGKETIKSGAWVKVTKDKKPEAIHRPLAGDKTIPKNVPTKPKVPARGKEVEDTAVKVHCKIAKSEYNKSLKMPEPNRRIGDLPGRAATVATEIPVTTNPAKPYKVIYAPVDREWSTTVRSLEQSMRYYPVANTVESLPRPKESEADPVVAKAELESQEVEEKPEEKPVKSQGQPSNKAQEQVATEARQDSGPKGSRSRIREVRPKEGRSKGNGEDTTSQMTSARKNKIKNKLENFAFVRAGKENPNKSDVSLSNTIVLYMPPEDQVLLYDKAACVATEAYIRMNGLASQTEYRSNCEYMSPNGRVPFLLIGTLVVSELEAIVGFIQGAGENGSEYDSVQGFMSLVDGTLSNAERYICWEDAETLRYHTKPRCAAPHPFPLNHVLAWRKGASERRWLKEEGWGTKSMDLVFKEVEVCLKHLSRYLGQNTVFIGNQCSALDALVYGHVLAIMSCQVSKATNRLAQIVTQNSNLVQLAKRIDKACLLGNFQRVEKLGLNIGSSTSTIESGMTEMTDSA